MMTALQIEKTKDGSCEPVFFVHYLGWNTSWVLSRIYPIHFTPDTAGMSG